MILKDIPIDEHAELQIGDERDSLYIDCEVRNVHSDGLIIVINKNGYILNELSILNEVNLVYNNKKIGTRLIWKCSIDNVVKYKSTTIIKISCADKGRSFNRRQTFRLPISLETKYLYHGQYIDTNITDLSISGISFKSNKEHELYEKVSMEIRLGNIRIELDAIILRINHNTNGKYEYKYGASTVCRNENALSKFIVDRQIEMISGRKRANGQE